MELINRLTANEILSVTQLASFEEVIDNILWQILDPCDMFEQLVSVTNIKNHVESIISGTTMIFYS